MAHSGKTRSVGLRLRQLFMAFPSAVLLAVLGGLPAQAADILFNFNSPTLYNPWTTFAAPPTTSNSAAITTYMNSLLPAGASVTVTGATSSGSPTNAGYAGEGHVVCSSGGPSSCTPETLATEYHTPFLVTNGSVQVGGDDTIKMVFAGNIQISGVSFAYEIFPDSTCPNAATCNPKPDFTFTMTSGGNTIVDCTVYAVAPGSAAPAATPTCSAGAVTLTSFTGGPSTTTSDNSPLSLTETSAQYIGTMTFTFATPVSAPTLYFTDWPATVGVTNIKVTTPPTQIPEPGSLVMLASGLFGLAIARYRRMRAKRRGITSS